MKTPIFFVKYLRKNYLTAIINYTVADPERCLPCSGKAKVSFLASASYKIRVFFPIKSMSTAKFLMITIKVPVNRSFKLSLGTRRTIWD